MNVRSWYKSYMVDVPESDSGDWSVSRYEVTEREEMIQRLRCMFNPQRPERYVPAGVYTMLRRGGTVVMTDTPDEIRDHLEPVDMTPRSGRCLVAGLGLGMVAKAMLEKHPDVKVTVVELSEDVIRIVGGHMKKRYGDRVDIVNADIMKWKAPRGALYDVAWFDIWDNICMDNLSEMRLLKRRYAKRAAWRGCWQEEGCRLQKMRLSKGTGLY